MERIQEIERERQHDKLYHLMVHAGVEELNEYVMLTRNSLTEQGVYPILAPTTTTTTVTGDPEDEEVCERIYRDILEEQDVTYKRAYIWVTLIICPQFVRIFCPADLSEPFLCDPEKMSQYLTRVNSPLTRLFAFYMSGQVTTAAFVAMATAGWFQLQPWKDIRLWANISANQNTNSSGNKRIESSVSIDSRAVKRIKE